MPDHNLDRRTRAGADAPPERERPARLELSVVRYEGRPDRGTVHPADATGVELMATWLSADLSAFADLGAWR